MASRVSVPCSTAAASSLRWSNRASTTRARTASASVKKSVKSSFSPVTASNCSLSRKTAGWASPSLDTYRSRQTLITFSSA